ncbi:MULTISPECIES: anthranilate synthase component I family protein [unclassified Streptomyces]|uniref:anthranilate synthase component I family protein n=1 Tax=unclassified Streptomyces TaxID=2593676 RepID=UPI000B4FD4E2|nr:MULTISPECIES: anthranilate synthase component I family protein [unclassified Streptomyces]MYX04199.1 anthranilate synthase component I family protein [Streptomyces sp. SID8378]SNB90854.1 anthranilate synthase component 1 [Streptomyces sp. PgraA7]
MPHRQPIGVRVTDAELPHHDPLELYARLRNVLPESGVFLFESLSGAVQDRRSAVVGFGRLAEIRVHGEHVDIEGAPYLVRALASAADTAGMTADHADARGVSRHRFTSADQVFDLLALAQGLFTVDTTVPTTSYAFGFLTTFGYESAWHMETLPARTAESPRPDITLTLFRDTVWYDVVTGAVRHLRAHSPAFEEVPVPGPADVAALAHDAAAARAAGSVPVVPEAPAPLSVRDSVSRDTFLGWAERCLEHIRVGDIYQIQIGHRVDVTTSLTPYDVYRRLRDRNPSPYMYLLPRAGSTLIGASPELFFRIEGDEIAMRPIAGTARRGPDDEENQRRVKEMRESTKEQAEHIMLVDLCRNDIGRVTRPSTQPVDRLMAVETYSHVFHLVSTVTGRLEEGVDTWQAVRATFPAGTMTGAPKVRAMEIIDGLEQETRGSYAGAVGLVDVRGWSELALCIRTIEYDGTTYSTQSSAGMVAQSEPEAEWRETLAKMGAAYWALTGEELLP